MTITPVSSLTSTSASAATSAASSASGTSSSGLASSLNLDFSTYLKILTAQLQNQDPTNATDPNQFTQELVEMGGVQQQITTNQDLTQLVTAQTSNSLATGASYIGNYVSANSSTGEFPLQGGTAEFGYTLGSGATTAIVNVSNSSGTVVAQLSGGTATGANYVAWNGENSSGTQLADGTYTFSVAATDANGNTIASSNPQAMFKVNSVQSNGDGTLQLIAGSLSLSTGDITGLYTTSTLPTTSYNAFYSAGTTSTGTSG
jgi:flagellar basal-body rod modification protein FlgD